MSLYGIRSLTVTLAVACTVVTGLLTVLPAAACAESAPSAREPEFKRLEGGWIRPDGGYLLDLRNTGKDGSVQAAYYNPRRINVARAKLGRDKGKVTLLVELRDVNYPGSTYTLFYDPKTDRLVGAYYQAVEKVTYDVEFVRAK